MGRDCPLSVTEEKRIVSTPRCEWRRCCLQQFEEIDLYALGSKVTHFAQECPPRGGYSRASWVNTNDGKRRNQAPDQPKLEVQNE